MSELTQTAQLAIDLLKKYKISDYELNIDMGSGTSTAVRLGKVETLQYHLDKNFSITVYLGKTKGSASSTGLTKENISKTIEAAYLIAKYTQKDKFNGLANKELMAFNIPDLDLYYPWDLSADKSIAIAKECEEIAMQQQYIHNSEGAELSSFEGEYLYANSNDLIAMQKNSKHYLYCSVISKKNKEMQTAYEYTTAIDCKDLLSSYDVGIKAAQLAQQKLAPKPLATQKSSVIFSANLASGLFSQLLGALSGSRQYKKSSFLLASMGKIVTANNINIIEHPLELKTIGSRAFDDDGVLKKERQIIKDGRVESYIMGQYSANQLGLKTTANSGGVNNVIISSNFNGGLEQIIKNTDKALVVTELMGNGINATTGDYSLGASGLWVENGEVQYPVAGITIAANLKDMLLGIEAIGTDIDYRNNIKVGSVLIKQMTLAGNK